MQEFSPIFLNKSCTLTHPQLHFVLLHSIPDIGTYTLIAYCMHFHFEPLNSLSRVISSICSDENISLCNAAKNGPRRAKTGPPTPLKGTYIPISGNVEVNLGLTPSNLCTWVSPLTMDGIISHLCSYLCVYRVLPQSGSHTSASSGCFSEDGSGFQLGGSDCVGELSRMQGYFPSLRLWSPPHAIHLHRAILSILCVLLRQAHLSGLILGITYFLCGLLLPRPCFRAKRN